MNARKRIAATVMLAGLAVPVLAGCGDGGPLGPDPDLARAAAVRQQAAAEVDKCVAGGTNRASCTAYGTDIWRTYPGHCGIELEKPLDAFRVERCAADLREAEAQGKSIPTVTATAAPMQASGERGIGSAVGNLFSTLLSLAMGFLCIFGIPGVIVWVIVRRVRADRRERAHAQMVHREEGSWQEGGGDYRPYAAPDQYIDQSDDHNPWA